MAKKIGIAALVLVLLLGGTAAWLWHRLTALPQWYGSADMIAEDGTPRVDEDWVRIPSADRQKKGAGTDPGGGDEVVYQLRNPHLRSTKPSPMKRAIKASKAVYKGGTLEAGAVVNMGDVDIDKLPPKDQKAYRDTIEAFPALTGRDVYVGIEGAGRDAEGNVVIGPGTKIRVGDTRYSVRKAAKRLGKSEAALRSQIEAELDKLDIDLPKE